MEIVAIAELNQGCASCGSDSYGLELKVGNFQPVIGICLSYAHVWHIEQGTHAWKKWLQLRRLAGEADL